MSLGTKLKFYSRIAATSTVMGMLLVACGKAKVDAVRGTPVVARSNVQTPNIAGEKPTERPPLPSDQELEEMIDIVDDTNTQEIANQVPDEDENPIPTELFIPDIPAQQEATVPQQTPRKVPEEKVEDTSADNSADKAPEKKSPPVGTQAPEPKKQVPAPAPEAKKQTTPPATSPATEPKKSAPAPVPEPKKQPTPSQPKSETKTETKPEETTAEKTAEKTEKGPKSQAVNYPDDGRLQKGASLLERRTSLGANSPFEFSKRTVDQRRYFATDDLVDFIEFMANYFRSLQPGHKLLISDLSVQGGGPVCCSAKQALSHQSHQNGLDADIAYLTKGDKDLFFAISAATVRQSVNLKAQLELFKQAQKTNTVDFILIHPSLKKELCIEAYKQGALDEGSKDNETIEALKVLIPDKSHHDHFHLRIKCDPKVHPKCLSRKRPQLTHGCVVKPKTVAK